MKNLYKGAVYLLLLALGCSSLIAGDENAKEFKAWREKFIASWRALPVPPVTTYSGHALGSGDWDDWHYMGFNTGYKGGGYESGRLIKAHGGLGYIAQTYWAGYREPYAYTYDGKPYGRLGGDEGCAFFIERNYKLGGEHLRKIVTTHGDTDLVKVGDTCIGSSWDELGIKVRAAIDYYPRALVLYREYLKTVWFGDESPDRDTNQDGRTYNAFTGEKLTSWDEVAPPNLTVAFHTNPQEMDQVMWRRPGAYKLWIDFHRYYTFKYFRDISDDGSVAAGRRMELYPFPLSFIMWPGCNAFLGLDYYWNARLSPIITNEQCQPDHPASTLGYAQLNHLSRKFGNVMMNWSWFNDQPDTVLDVDRNYGIERALARLVGHRSDGIQFFIDSPFYKTPPFNSIRAQLGFWHNFFARQYPAFLAHSEPLQPTVALLAPDYSGYFYRQWQLNKQNYAFTSQALSEAQIPFAVVSEHELELDAWALDSFKLLYVVSSEWSTPTIRQRITEFMRKGGTICVDSDSLSLDITTGKRTDFLEKMCGAKLLKKYKTPLYPTMQNAEESAWAAPVNTLITWQSDKLHHGVLSRFWQKDAVGNVVRNEGTWKQLDDLMAKMPRIGRGNLAQEPIDMREPPKIRYAAGIGATDGLIAYGDIATAQVKSGKPIAWKGNEVCGVETAQAVWLGSSPGMGVHALFPRIAFSHTWDLCNPFTTSAPDDFAAHQPYVDLVAYAARKAGIIRPVSVLKDGKIPCNIEVLPRTDNAGNLMVVIINHDATDATYQVVVADQYVREKLPKKATAWNVLANTLIEEDTDGHFDMKLAPWRASVVFLGEGPVLQRIQQVQTDLLKTHPLPQ
jgi:hypothetical protein